MIHRHPQGYAILSTLTGPVLATLLIACTVDDGTGARPGAGGHAGSDGGVSIGAGGKSGGSGTAGNFGTTGTAGSAVGVGGATGTGGAGGADVDASGGAGGAGGTAGDLGMAGAGGEGGGVVLPPACTVPESGGKDLSTLVSGPQTLEAEDAELTGSAVLVNNVGTGWIGKGYADMAGQEGGMVFVIDVPAKGDYKVTWKYTQEENRDMALNVNCVETVPSVQFSSTGSWNSNWKSDVSQTLALLAGTNRISLATNGGSGPNFDQWTFEMTFKPPTCKATAGATVECEGEQALMFGGTGPANAGTGWTGTGYADMFGKEGGVTWVVDAPSAGTYGLTFVYTQDDSRDMTLKVNAAVTAASVAFMRTNSWDSNWVRDVKANVTLKAGLNAVTLATNGGSGPNFDKVLVAAPASDAGTPAVDAGPSDAGGG